MAKLNAADRNMTKREKTLFLLLVAALKQTLKKDEFIYIER